LIPRQALPKQQDIIGPLAQLGERLHGMQEVSGSIPLGSTISLKNSIKSIGGCPTRGKSRPKHINGLG
jgi:hypothetical protein